MRKFILFAIFLATAIAVQAQTQIKGNVIDTLANRPLHKAVAMLVSTKDSTLLNFQRTDAQGHFDIKIDTAGEYLLWVTYPGFVDLVNKVTVPASGINMGKMALTEKSRMLDAVMIRANGAIRIKGDTTEFVADSFKVREGATVEELLKVLPGFQVNSNGEITAGGRTVKKVLVDGEEFFGDDPTMATRNLSARIVDKVQVYDEQTDQQRLKSLSSGDNTTVNIKLKEDEKKGSFGRVHGATNLGKLMDASLLYNQFKGNRKFSAYANKSTINTSSLSWDLQRKLGIEQDYEYDEISDMYYSFGTSDDFNSWSVRGLPNSYAAGALFGNKWNADKQKINLSYRYNRLGTENQGYNLNQTILPTGSTYRILRQSSSGLNTQHAVNVKYEWQLDSLRSLKLVSALSSKQTELYSSQNGEFLGIAFDTINKSRQDRTQLSDQKKTESQLVFKQKFNKKDRLLLATFRLTTVEDDQNGTIYTSTAFFKNSVQDSVDIADQFKRNTGNSLTGSGKLTYNEPLSEKLNLVFDYGFTTSASNSHKNTFNRDGAGKYTVKDQVFSNNFELDVNSHNASVNLRYMSGKFKGILGSGLTNTVLKLYNIDNQERNRYSFLNLAPVASYSYSIRPQTVIALSYRGNPNPPNINQLQPIRDNTDRLREFIGNPDLKVGFNHNITLNYRTHKALKSMGIWSYLNLSLPKNDISYYNYINISRGTQAYTPVNVNGNRSMNGSINFYKESKDEKYNFSIRLNGSARRNYNFVNQLLNGQSVQLSNRTNSGNFSFQPEIGYNIEKKFYVRIGPRAERNFSTSSLNPQQNLRYWIYGGEGETNFEFSKKFFVNASVNANFREKIAAFQGSPNSTIINMRAGKRWLKNSNLVTEFIANDLLNQNIGFSRTINSNYIVEDRYARISQYFLFRVEYSFTKTGSQPGK